jgi:hypothetical protein
MAGCDKNVAAQDYSRLGLFRGMFVLLFLFREPDFVELLANRIAESLERPWVSFLIACWRHRSGSIGCNTARISVPTHITP